MGRNRNKDRKKKANKEEPEEKQSFKEQGNKAFLAGNFERAIELYDHAIKADPSDHSVLSNRSAAFLNIGNFDAALADAEKCIELKDDWAKGYYRKGEALREQVQLKESKEAFDKAASLQPDDKKIKAGLEKVEKALAELNLSEQELTKGAPNPDADKFGVMVKWLKDGGAKFPLLYLRYYDEDYRGVHCLTKVKPNTQILYIPHSHIMTSEKAKASKIGQRIISQGVQLRSKHSYLAAYLLQEKHDPKSFWQPYIKILPEKYRNMPIFFNDEEMKELEGSFVYEKIFARTESLKDEYETICESVPEFRQFTAWDFIWARLVVITRIFGLMIDGNKTDGLVPYADMLNHKIPRETSWTFDDKQFGFTIIATRGIDRGAEVFDSYGRKCNSRFFVNYGFTLDENDDNEVVIKVTIPRADPQYNTKIALLGNNPANAIREFQIPAFYDHEKTKDAFTFLRFAHAKDSEIALLPRPKDGVKLEEIEPISVENELKVLKHLRMAATAVMDGYPTTLDYDEQQLKRPRGELTFNMRNCINMRAGEKRVLKWYMDLHDAVKPYFDMPWKDLKRAAAKCYSPEATNLEKYIRSVVVPLINPKNNRR